MDALWNSAESDMAIEESQEMTCRYSPPSSPHFSPSRLPFPRSPNPRNSEESDKTIEESQEMTCRSIPPPPTDSSPLRSACPWSPIELSWSPSYLLDKSPTDFSQLPTDFPQSSAHVLRSPSWPFSPLPEPSPLSNSVVACRGSNQSINQKQELQLLRRRQQQQWQEQWKQLKLELQDLLQLSQQEQWEKQERLQLEWQKIMHARLQRPELWSSHQLWQLPLRQQLLHLPQPQQLLQLLRRYQLLLQQPLRPLRWHQLPQRLLQLQQHPLPWLVSLVPLLKQLSHFEFELLLYQQLFEPPQKNNSNALNLNPTRNIGTFNTAEEATIARDRMVVRPSFLNKNIVEPKTANIIEIPPWSAQQEDDLDENSVFGYKEATGNDEIEATGEDQMAEGGLNFGILGKRKRKVKTSGGERETKKSGTKIAIPLEDILQVKGMSRKEAAIKLDVSESTLKRVCREYGIPRWRPRENNKLISDSLLTETRTDVDQASGSINTNTVTVKARSEKGITIKFQLSSPWRRLELEQQVEMRLPLKAGTYYLKYKDEENELILIGCDKDLEDYISNSTSMDTNLIEVFIEPK